MSAQSRCRLVALLLVATVGLWPAVVAADGLATAPWPMHQGDAQHSGRSTAAGPAEPTLAWSVTSDAAFAAGAVIGASNSIYVVADDGHVRMFSPNGQELWSRRLGAKVGATPALTAQGDVLIAALDGTLHALDQANGATRWTFDSGSDIRGSPAVAADGSIVFGTDAGDLFVLTPAGQERSRRRAGGGAAIFGPPTIGPGDVIYWGAQDARVYAGSIHGGVLWSKQLRAPVEAGPVIGADGTVYVAANSLWALDPLLGAERWHAPTGGHVRATPAVGTDGTVYVTAASGLVSAIAPDGAVRWTYQTGGDLRASPAIAGNGLIYVPAGDSLLYVFDASGQLVGTFKTFDGLWASPAIGSDGRLYLGGRNQRFYALQEGGRVFGQSPPDRLGGNLLRDPVTGRVFVLVDGIRRHIPDPTTQLLLGLAGRTVNATALELARYPEGAPLPTIHEGTLLRSQNGPVYVVQDKRRVWVRSMAQFIAGGYRWAEVRTVDDRVIRSQALEPSEGLLLAGSGDEVYVIEAGKRRWISSLAAFAARGYRWDQVHPVSDTALQAIALGAPI